MQVYAGVLDGFKPVACKFLHPATRPIDFHATVMFMGEVDLLRACRDRNVVEFKGAWVQQVGASSSAHAPVTVQIVTCTPAYMCDWGPRDPALSCRYRGLIQAIMMQHDVTLRIAGRNVAIPECKVSKDITKLGHDGCCRHVVSCQHAQPGLEHSRVRPRLLCPWLQDLAYMVTELMDRDLWRAIADEQASIRDTPGASRTLGWYGR